MLISIASRPDTRLQIQWYQLWLGTRMYHFQLWKKNMIRETSKMSVGIHTHNGSLNDSNFGNHFWQQLWQPLLMQTIVKQYICTDFDTFFEIFSTILFSILCTHTSSLFVLTPHSVCTHTSFLLLCHFPVL